MSNSLDQATEVIFEEFVVSLEELCIKLGLNCSNNVNFDQNYSGIWLSKTDWKHVNIGFQFQSYDKNLVYGFAAKHNPEKVELPSDLKSEFKNISGNSIKSNGWWPWYSKIEEPYGDWSKYQAWNAILNGDMLRIMQEKIEYLLANTNHLQL